MNVFPCQVSVFSDRCVMGRVDEKTLYLKLNYCKCQIEKDTLMMWITQQKNKKEKKLSTKLMKVVDNKTPKRVVISGFLMYNMKHENDDIKCL